MNDKRNYVLKTLTALTILGLLMLFYVLSPIPVLHLGMV